MSEAEAAVYQRPASVTTEEATDLRYIPADTIKFERHGASLRLHDTDFCYLRVTVLRAFPLSEPDRYLSVRDGDNREIGIIREPDQLDSESRQLVMDELRRRYLVPVILRVRNARDRFGTIDWEVDTDRGPRSFTTRNLRDNTTRPSPGRYILTDADGNRFDVPALDDLDSASQVYLLRHL
ncbi:MAG TPA: DUF1854 domain-containing protein [Armatimonadota bacterium]|nr:DUF1854 domain-containing protein [Armatimonadota bacterium]